jgi:hypothetical protein
MQRKVKNADDIYLDEKHNARLSSIELHVIYWNMFLDCFFLYSFSFSPSPFLILVYVPDCLLLFPLLHLRFFLFYVLAFQFPYCRSHNYFLILPRDLFHLLVLLFWFCFFSYLQYTRMFCSEGKCFWFGTTGSDAVVWIILLANTQTGNTKVTFYIFVEFLWNYLL